MEVNVRNISKQATEKLLERDLRKYFTSLSITDVHWAKSYNQTRASLTFLRKADGVSFFDSMAKQDSKIMFREHGVH